jgi:BirA family biotin operon repressor/biotin-[acetyl-CoA-carboxylase] ligase
MLQSYHFLSLILNLNRRLNLVRSNLQMRIIKLDAIDSTNDYLKLLSREQEPEDFTTVIAETQLKGKGQMGAKWVAEAGKNLTMSTLSSGLVTHPENIYALNIAVSLSILSALNELQVPRLSVKWPNDIMSGNKKLAGILIENLFQGDGLVRSVIGIGINVNQSNFDDLPQATSILLTTGSHVDKEMLAIAVIHKLQQFLPHVVNNVSMLWDSYKMNLYRFGLPTAFEDIAGQFMAIITDVTANGKLVLTDEDDLVREYGIKEVKMLY